MFMPFPVLAPVCQEYSRLSMLLAMSNMLYGALNTILVANTYNVPVPESPDNNDEDQHIIIVCHSFK